MRLDKFLKVSRLIKRRTVANTVSEMGRVLVNGSSAKPAKQLKVGDIIVSIGGKVISTASEATAEISNYEVGDKVEIGIIRDGRTKTLTAELEEYKGQ